MPQSTPLLRPMRAEDLMRRSAPFARETEETPMDLTAGFSLEDDEDFDQEDAMPTEQMPVPVCVPLYDLNAEKPRRKTWPFVIAALLALGAAGAVLWYLGILPEWIGRLL